jgi:hypothetical protein
LHGGLLGYLVHFSEFAGYLHVVRLEHLRVVTVQYIFGLEAKHGLRGFVDSS